MHFNNDEDLSGLPIYDGLRDCCDYCGKKFQMGDLISVAADSSLAFCLLDLASMDSSDIPCLLKWALKHNQIVPTPKIFFCDGF